MDTHPSDEPIFFSLVCLFCDRGDDIDDEAQATAEGWTDIVQDLDLPQANYSGLCPDCRVMEEEQDRAGQAERRLQSEA